MTYYLPGQLRYYSGIQPEYGISGIPPQRGRHMLFTLSELDVIATQLFSFEYTPLALGGNPVEFLGADIVSTLTLDVYGSGCSYMPSPDHPPRLPY